MRGREQTVDVAPPVTLHAQCGLVLLRELRRIDDRDHLLQCGTLALRLVTTPAEGLQLTLTLADLTASHREVPRHGLGLRPRERVQDRQLGRPAHQATPLVLRREANEPPRDGGRGGACRRLTVDEGPGTSLRGHATRHHDLVRGIDELPRGQGRVIVVQVVPEAVPQADRGLHERVPGTGPHRARVGAAAHEERERLGDHGLPRSRLSRDRGQSRRRLDLRRVDHHQPADAEPPDHGRPNFSR